MIQVPSIVERVSQLVGRWYSAGEVLLEPIVGHGQVFRLTGPVESGILKLSTDIGQDSIRREAVILKALGQSDIPVPQILRQGRDADVGDWLLMTDLGPSNVLEILLTGNPNGEALTHSMGVQFARLHQVNGTSLAQALRDAGFAESPPTDLNRHRSAVTWAQSKGLLSAEAVRAILALPIPDDRGDRICHHDFHAVQCIVRDGEITGIVDWSGGRLGDPLIDLAIARAYLDSYLESSLSGAFVAGYQTVATIPEDHLWRYLAVRVAVRLAIARVLDARGEIAGLRRIVSQLTEELRRAED